MIRTKAMRELSSMPTVSVPTSDILHDLLDEAPRDAVTLDSIMKRLDERSFGLITLLLALLAMVPGISLVAGTMIIWTAGQMILARPRATLPRFVARHTVPTARLTRLIERMVPELRWLERLIRPRWSTPFTMTKSVGLVVLLLGISLFSPVPLSNFIPALVIMGMALAYLEKDGVMLAIATAVACVSLVAMAATICATVAGIQFLKWSW
jgi:hypothetical protein